MIIIFIIILIVVAVVTIVLYAKAVKRACVRWVCTRETERKEGGRLFFLTSQDKEVSFRRPFSTSERKAL